ncbi:MAG TPA: hypothetical protein VFZ65_19475, partial [Planctomycetota bacterium]|nr:hypothetical protein [Planctomycetota bacterium]
MDLQLVLRGVLPPIGAALLLVSLGGVRLLPLAVAAGLLAAYVLVMKAWPALPHELWVAPNGTEWLLWGVAASALVATLEHVHSLPARSGPALAVGAGAGAVWLVLEKAASHWSGGDAWLQIGGGALAVVLLVLGQRTVLARAPSGLFPAVLFTVVLSIDAVLLALGKSALLGQLCGAVAAALGA